MEGIAAAKARGVYKGRTPRIDPAAVRRLRDEETLGAAAIARRLGIGRASVYRLNRALSSIRSIPIPCRGPAAARPALAPARINEAAARGKRFTRCSARFRWRNSRPAIARWTL
jgi:hypothetical protein